MAWESVDRGPNALPTYARPLPGTDYSKPQNLVDKPSPAYDVMAARWELIDDLLIGLSAMRAAGTKWLPRDHGEESAQYAARLGRTFLYNATRATIEDLADKVVEKEIELGEDAPERLVAMTPNVDRQGTTLSAFGRSILVDGFAHGITYVLVDFPPKPPEVVRTVADERAMGLRPFFAHYRARDVIGWRSRVEGGAVVLTQLRVRECAEVEEGEFGSRVVRRVRVFDLVDGGQRRTVRWRLYEAGKDGDFEPADEGAMTRERIPLVAFAFNADGFMTAAPPFEDLAQKNLEHYQSASDQRHVLHVGRLVSLFGAGITRAELGLEPDAEGGGGRKAEIPFGPSAALFAENPQAKLQLVELQTGIGLTHGEKDLERLEEQMATLGVAPLLPRKRGTVTAEERKIDAGDEDSWLKSAARVLREGLEACFALAASWIGDEGATVAVKVHTDWRVPSGTGDLSTLDVGRARGDLSRRRWWAELSRRRVLGDDFDPEAEETALEDEALEAAKRMADAGLAPGAGPGRTDDDPGDDDPERE